MGFIIKSRISSLTITSILILINFTVFLPLETCEATTGNAFYVDDDGGGNYTYIQDAIDNASDKDAIYVFSGTYYENIIIDKQLTIIGIDKPIIDGNETGSTTISILTDNVSLSGFIVTNSDPTNSTKGVDIKSNKNTISQCIIKNINRGIYIYMGHNNVIQDNVIEGNYLNGIDLIKSNNNTILENEIHNNMGEGINLWRANNNSIEGNNITTNNKSGIFTTSSSNNTIIKNTLQNNVQYGIHLFLASENNIIFHNNFVNNTNQVEDECANIWYSSSSQEGNYWSDYVKEYPDAAQINGAWITPYNISGDDNQDVYPLVKPYEKNEVELKNDTPGFELVFVIVAVIIVLFWRMKMQNSL